MLSKIFSVISEIVNYPKESLLPKITISTGFISQSGVPDTVQFDMPTASNGFKKVHLLRQEMIDAIYDFGIECNYFPIIAEAKSAILEKISASYFIDLAINSMPDIFDKAKLKIMAKWIYILFKFDDIIDDKESIFQDKSIGDRVELASKFATESYRMLATGKLDIKTTTDLKTRILVYNKKEWSSIEKLFTSLNKLYADILGLYDNDLELMQRKSDYFRVEVNQYFQSAVTELRALDTVDHSTYLEHRKKSGAVPTVFALSMPLYDLDIPDAIKNCDGYQAMIYHANLAICLVNDGVSSGKEWDSPEPNYIKVRFSDYKRDGFSSNDSFRKSKEELGRLHDKNISEYLEGIETLDRQLSLHQLHMNDSALLELDASEKAFQDLDSNISLLYKSYAVTIAKIKSIVENWILSNFYYSENTDRYKFKTKIPE